MAGKSENSLLQNLTLVVPSYSRQEFLLRLLRFWRNQSVRVVALDGSSCRLPAPVVDEVGGSVTYLHNEGGLYDRLGLALECIETKYVALAGDDEFYLPSALRASVSFLESHPDHVSCLGRAVGFGCEDSEVYGGRQYPKLADYRVEQDAPRDRARYHLAEYVPSMIYAVARRDVWVTALRTVVSEELPFFAAGELQMEILMSAAGKSRVLPHLHWLRSKGETPPVRGTDASLDEKVRLWHWWESAPAGEKQDFLDRMAEGVREVTGGQEKDPHGLVLRACEAYLSAQEAKRRSGRPRGFARKATRLLPAFAHDRLLRWHRSRRAPAAGKGSKQSLVEAAKDLEQEGVTVAWDELGEVERTVAEFHAKRRLRYGF